MSWTRNNQLREVCSCDRPADGEWGADCFVALLTDFLALDLRKLSPETFEEWISIVADCLWVFAETEVSRPHACLGAANWFRLVNAHILRHFPEYPNGAEQLSSDLACLMLYRQRQKPS